jgi:hypothetical protein
VGRASEVPVEERLCGKLLSHAHFFKLFLAERREFKLFLSS